MKNQIFKITLTSIFLLLALINTSEAQPPTPNPHEFVDFIGVTNHGIRFWNGDNNYRIAMGTGAEYHYGPVSDYSIKTSMVNMPGRGWVWGTQRQTPVTALNVSGEFQTEGYIKSMARKFYFGDNQSLEGNDKQYLTYSSNSSTVTGLIFTDKEGTQYGRVYGDSNGENFGLLDRNGNWSYVSAADEHTTFYIAGNEIMHLKADGNVGIGTNDPQNKLEVCGVIRAKEVLVEETWCDFVFEPEYCLTTLEEEAEFIEMYGHLSNFESAKDMNGEINVNDIFKRQQIQLEENVLHLIELNEENEALHIQVNSLMEDVDQLTGQVDILTANYQMLAKELAVIKKQLR